MNVKKTPVQKAPKRTVSKMSRADRRRREKKLEILTVAACIILPPVGIYMVWRRKWNGQIKYGLTAAAVAVMALVVTLMPMADRKVPGGVTLIGAGKQAEVYGPELPEDMVPGRTVADDSVVSEDDEDTEEITYYYAQKNEEYYHEYTCKKAYASSQKLTLYEAYYLGYEPCPQCNPPVFDDGSADTDTDTEG